MLAFTINDTKTFMSLLLKGDTFDHFVFRQGEINGLVSLQLNGRKDASFKEGDNDEDFCLWAEVKPIVFQAVKGKQLPKNMKLVFSLTDAKTTHYENTKAVFLNLLFREHTLLCTTSIAQSNFSLDKHGEELWESDILRFFKKHEIGIQIQK